MVVSGFWIVRNSPDTGALSSSLDWEGSLRLRLRGTSADFREGPTPSADAPGSDISDARFCSAMAETAASTFRSKSSSLTVKLVRSNVSINWMAPD